MACLCSEGQGISGGWRTSVLYVLWALGSSPLVGNLREQQTVHHAQSSHFANACNAFAVTHLQRQFSALSGCPTRDHGHPCIWQMADEDPDGRCWGSWLSGECISRVVQ